MCTIIYGTQRFIMKTTQSTRKATKTPGVSYKDILNEKGKSIDKIYSIRWRDENGKSKLKVIGKYSAGIREKYCKNKLDEIVTKIRLGEDLPHLAKPKQHLTISDMATIYFDYKRPLIVDVDKEIGKFNNHLKKRIGDILLQNLTEKKIAEVIEDLNETLAPATTKGILVLLNAMYKYVALKKLYVGELPTIDLAHSDINNSRERYLTIPETKKLLDVCYNSHFEIYLFVRLALSTGGRVGSIHTIKAVDVKIENNSLTLSDHKNKDRYTAFYNDDLKDILRERLKELSPSDYVIKLHKTTVIYKLRAILDVLFNQKLKHNDRKNRVVPHTLRHTFASQLAIKGTPILTIKRLMNHKSIEMTMRYAKLAPDQGMDAVIGLYE